MSVLPPPKALPAGVKPRDALEMIWDVCHTASVSKKINKGKVLVDWERARSVPARYREGAIGYRSDIGGYLLEDWQGALLRIGDRIVEEGWKD